MAQNTTAVQRDDIAYTSDSTAENQNVSENVYAKAPTAPAPRICTSLPSVGSAPRGTMVFRTKAVIVQNRKSIVRPLDTAEPKFIQNAIRISSPNARLENTFCSIRNRGAPGRCTICIL